MKAIVVGARISLWANAIHALEGRSPMPGRRTKGGGAGGGIFRVLDPFCGYGESQQ
jgi:hypothetical protein